MEQYSSYFPGFRDYSLKHYGKKAVQFEGRLGSNVTKQAIQDFDISNIRNTELII